jgi:hypothetical protein
MTNPTPQPDTTAPATSAAPDASGALARTDAPAAANGKARLVDLGREEERVPWSEWFVRSAQAMEQVVQAGSLPDLPRVFRVTLRDGRPFAVLSVKTHIARGKCQDMLRGWCELPKPAAGDGGGGANSELCDVITGYTLVGTDHNGRPVVLAVPPTEIASVECLLVPQAQLQQKAGQRSADDPDDEPFGFAAFQHRKEQQSPEVEEVDEPTLFSQAQPGGLGL